MTNITTQISDDLHHSLSFVAKKMHRSEDDIIHKAIEAYVQALQEDIEDYNAAIEALNDTNPTISWERVQKEHGLLED